MVGEGGVDGIGPLGQLNLLFMMWQKSKVIIQVPAAMKMLMGNTRV